MSSNSPEQRIADLIAELRAELAEVPAVDLEFDKEHQQMFLENAQSLAPLIPGMIPEEKAISGTPVQTKEDIWSIIKSNQDKIKAFGVKKLGLFGSFVRKEQRKESDIDLLVEFESGKKTFRNFMQLSFLLEDLLKRQIELVTVESLSPYIRPFIIKEVEYVTFTS